MPSALFQHFSSFHAAKELEGLKAELPTYLAKATDVGPNLMSGLVESVRDFFTTLVGFCTKGLIGALISSVRTSYFLVEQLSHVGHVQLQQYGFRAH